MVNWNFLISFYGGTTGLSATRFNVKPYLKTKNPFGERLSWILGVFIDYFDIKDDWVR
jgi:hypothetical protein